MMIQINHEYYETQSHTRTQIHVSVSPDTKKIMYKPIITISVQQHPQQLLKAQNIVTQRNTPPQLTAYEWLITIFQKLHSILVKSNTTGVLNNTTQIYKLHENNKA
ncbi:hypothetical protein SS50377_23913 [Spironucleus salmonicida]|uniref:Uncharacterized protein n=1 Tax=Spironucleus salmonicida TaxID=348837 RepID=A0A9P8LT94_9EUKA|nr:hypothetical protein SS50377_23913 [Spironucleus salmonicida]